MSSAESQSSWITASGMQVPARIFDYEVIDFIGEGARSKIYAVTHPQSKQLYALKHVICKSEKDQRFFQQLQDEFDIGSRITHPNLRRSIELKVKRTLLRKVNEAALVLELFDGRALEFALPRNLPPLIHCFIQTAQALDALHGHGYVHCDLKPNNIMLSAGGAVKVIDLGQACKIGTAKKRIQGTPDYIAPEQVKLQPVTIRTDIFNLGATMYWCLCGRKMPTLYTVGKGENSFLVDDQLPSPGTINPMVPEQLSNFVMECVRTDPKKRPADMSEVTRRLEIIQHSINRDSNQARGSVA